MLTTIEIWHYTFHTAYLTTSKEKEQQQLLAELEMTKHESQVKDGQVSKLKDELQAKQVEMTSLLDQCE